MSHYSLVLSRHAFLAASTAALTAPAIAAGPTPAPATLRVGGSPDADFVGTLYGVRSGIFQKLGLTVDAQRLSSGSAVSAAVAGGALDIGRSSVFSLIVGHVRGIPFVIQSESAIYNAAEPNVGFVVAKNNPITSARELNGKTIASPSLGDIFSAVATAWIDQNGGDSKTVKFVELPGPATAVAIAAGRIDGAVLVDPILAEAVSSGQCRNIGRPFDAIAKRFGATFYFCTRDYASRNAEVLGRFRRGLADAARYANTHRAEVAPLIADFTGVSVEMARQRPIEVGFGMDPAMLQPVIDFAAKTKLIPAAFPARDLIDPAALRS